MDEERYPALPWQGWKIVKRLGRGGYGSVYLAQRNSAGVMEDAAVKVLSQKMKKTLKLILQMDMILSV